MRVIGTNDAVLFDGRLFGPDAVSATDIETADRLVGDVEFTGGFRIYPTDRVLAVARALADERRKAISNNR